MYYCYKAEVEKRGLVMKNDEHILGAIKDASSWLIEGKKPGLLLYGGIGNGKTTLANAICMYINQAQRLQRARCVQNHSDHSIQKVYE